MSTACVSVPARSASTSITAIFATATAITFSTVAGAPTPVYRFYREALSLTPFTITLIFAVYSFTMIAAFLTVARLSDTVRHTAYGSALSTAVDVTLAFIAAAIVLSVVDLVQSRRRADRAPSPNEAASPSRMGSVRKFPNQ